MPALEELAMTRPVVEYAGPPSAVVIDDIALVSNTWTMTDGASDGSLGVSASRRGMAAASWGFRSS